MSDAKRDDGLAERVAELEETLEALRTRLDRPRRRLLRPPSPGDLLGLADAGVTATIAVLEANVRALELLQRSIRVAGGREGEARGRAGELSRETLDRLDRALAEIGDALEGLPTDPGARGIVEDARRLNAEIRDEIEAGGGTEIAVEEELESIKDEVGREDGDEDGDGVGG